MSHRSNEKRARLWLVFALLFASVMFGDWLESLDAFFAMAALLFFIVSLCHVYLDDHEDDVRAYGTGDGDDVHVFLVEDKRLARRLIDDHFGNGITFAQVFDAKDRSKFTKAMEDADL